MKELSMKEVKVVSGGKTLPYYEPKDLSGGHFEVRVVTTVIIKQTSTVVWVDD